MSGTQSLIMDIAGNLEKIRNELPEGVKLIAISKTKPAELIRLAYDAGHTSFGENKVQDLAGKHEALPKDVEWHMVGHLQTNKVKYIASFIHLIHSVDRYKVLKTIHKEAAKHQRVIPCLLQVHIAEEETKFGFSEKELFEMLDSTEYQKLTHVKITGLMGMATFTGNMDQIRKEFRYLKGLKDRLKQQFFAADPGFRELSMGMTGDYKIAIEEGSTMVRIGTLIFGERNRT